MIENFHSHEVDDEKNKERSLQPESKECRTSTARAKSKNIEVNREPQPEHLVNPFVSTCIWSCWCDSAIQRRSKSDEGPREGESLTHAFLSPI